VLDDHQVSQERALKGPHSTKKAAHLKRHDGYISETTIEGEQVFRILSQRFNPLLSNQKIRPYCLPLA